METEDVPVENLIEILTKMYSSTIVLDEEALKKLSKARFTHPVDFANHCFKCGWNEAVKVVLQSLRKPDEDINKE